MNNIRTSRRTTEGDRAGPGEEGGWRGIRRGRAGGPVPEGVGPSEPGDRPTDLGGQQLHQHSSTLGRESSHQKHFTSLTTTTPINFDKDENYN